MKLGVGALIFRDDGKVLLRKHSLAPEDGKWSLPGGPVEEDETPDQAVLRQVKEEVGPCDAELLDYLGALTYVSEDGGSQELSMLYHVRLRSPSLNAEPELHSSLRWCSRDSVPPELSSPAERALALHGVTGGLLHYSNEYAPHVTDVILVQPFFPLADVESLSLPLGLASIHSMLKRRGMSVRTLDCSLPTDYLRFCNELRGNSPSVVGVQFHSDMSFDWAKKTCRFVRSAVPGSLIVAGGELATAKSTELIEGGYVDFVVRDEGEDTFMELVTAAFGRSDPVEIRGVDCRNLDSGRVCSNAPRPLIPNLDDLPLPEISELSWREYGQWTLFTSRGCPYRCTYCSSAAYWKHIVRYNSPARIVAEISRLVCDYGATDIYIADDTFTLNHRRIYDTCRLINKRGLRPKWSCLTRADCVDEAILREMSGAGCAQVSFGMETANQQTLDGVSKHISGQRIEQALKWCHAMRIRTRVSIIIGLPGESTDDVMQTMKTLLRLRPDEIQLYGLTPHAGTALYSDLESHGIRIIEPDRMLWSRNVLEPVCETNLLPRAKIVQLAERFLNEFQSDGYTYINPEMKVKKVGADKTIATAFSPVQAIGGVNG